MPLQETFLEKQLSDGRALVIKTYDANLAHDAFQHIGEDALAYVANALRLEELFEAGDIPETSSPDYTDFVWETLSDEAREDGNEIFLHPLPGSPRAASGTSVCQCGLAQRRSVFSEALGISDTSYRHLRRARRVR
jgi:hypothetical protein